MQTGADLNKAPGKFSETGRCRALRFVIDDDVHRESGVHGSNARLHPALAAVRVFVDGFVLSLVARLAQWDNER